MSRIREIATGLDRVATGEVKLPATGNIGLLTNRAARTREGRWSADALREAGYRLSVLIGPEHGLAGKAGAGAPVPHDRHGDLPVLSMYGADRAQVAEALRGLDLVVVDLPDVGCRYYTYPWTVRELLRMAGPVPVTILDRPNPLNGVTIEGNIPVLDSAVCASHVPVRHGLTLGELSLWNLREFGIPANVRVIPCSGWKRGGWPEDLPWFPPSPNLRTLQAVYLYPGTCLLEGTNVSEGRGTAAPFEVVGAPFVDGEALAHRLRALDAFAGTDLSAVRFTPRESKWSGDVCYGVQISLHGTVCPQPVRAGLTLVAELRRIPGFEWRPAHFDALAGTDVWRLALDAGTPVEEIVAGWRVEEDRFALRRESVLLYGG